jgi:hypothetical protein
MRNSKQQLTMSIWCTLMLFSINPDLCRACSLGVQKFKWTAFSLPMLQPRHSCFNRDIFASTVVYVPASSMTSQSVACYNKFTWVLNDTHIWSMNDLILQTFFNSCWLTYFQLSAWQLWELTFACFTSAAVWKRNLLKCISLSCCLHDSFVVADIVH